MALSIASASIASGARRLLAFLRPGPAAWLAVGMGLPSLAIVVTVALYLARDSWPALPDAQSAQSAPAAQGPRDWLLSHPLLGGGTIALLAWYPLALLVRGWLTVKRSNTLSYGELDERCTRLKARLQAISTASHHVVDEVEREATLRSVRLGLDACCNALQSTDADPRWLLASGYADLWKRLHGIEEALLAVDSLDTVIADAAHDRLRINGSTIPNREELIAELDKAEHAITARKSHRPRSAAAAGRQVALGVPSQRSLLAAIAALVAATPAELTSGHPLAAPSAACGEGSNGGSTEAPLREAQARLMLQRVRHGINAFRDSRRDALIRARNHFITAVVLTTAALYLVFALVILGWNDRDQVGAAVSFYLVGALVGLFNRMLVASETEQDIEDFGFSAVRLLHTPVFCGLAAIIGVALVSMLPMAAIRLTPGSLYAVSAPPATTGLPAPVVPGESLPAPADARPQGGAAPPAGVSATGTAPTQEYPALENVFHVGKNPLGLLTAAVFGLTPTLVVDRLRQQAKRYTDDLKSTQAQDRVAPAT